MHSPKFDLVKRYYDAHLWNRAMVVNATKFPAGAPWITEEEANEILGIIANAAE